LCITNACVTIFFLSPRTHTCVNNTCRLSTHRCLKGIDTYIQAQSPIQTYVYTNIDTANLHICRLADVIIMSKSCISCLHDARDKTRTEGWPLHTYTYTLRTGIYRFIQHHTSLWLIMCCPIFKGVFCTAILMIIEGQFQVIQRLSSSKLVLKTVDSRFVALNYYENGSKGVFCIILYCKLNIRPQTNCA
jgi:hypothetical protein